MTPREQKLASALAVFLTAALPAAAGAIAFRAQPVLLTLIASEPSAISAVTNFFFNHFSGALLTLFALGSLTTVLAFRAFRLPEEEALRRMTQLLVTVCLSALLSVGFLALMILATALPLYSRFTQR
ncbi:hypothetical protein LBMAG55_04020 [Verrucomicrobiota bacterium]|nr:hypothetical protein LBMAG55_04020 [Verrucomicrobiota bacterium]